MKKSFISYCMMLLAVLALTFVSCGETAPADATDEATESMEAVENAATDAVEAVDAALDTAAMKVEEAAEEATEAVEEATEGGE